MTTQISLLSPPSNPGHLSDAEFHSRSQEWRTKFLAMSKEEKREVLIRIGALTPEGKLPVYPMDDHVPYGPQS